MVQNRKATIYIIITVLLFLLFLPFFGGKHNCLHAKSRYKQGKYFNHNFYQRKICRLWRELNTLPSTSSFTDSLFSIFRRKSTGPIPRKRASKWLFPRRHNKQKHKQRSKRFSYKERMLK